jgi:hypothetical protein
LDNHYELLGVKPGASISEIKKAFRNKAKQLHPDIAGSAYAEAMRKLINAYEALSDIENRFEHDFRKSAVYPFYAKKTNFDYRTWLSEQDDPASKAKFVFYELMRLEEEKAIALWRENGGLGFQMEKYLERGDWMDCYFLLAEELDRRGFCFEAFKLLTAVITEEKRRPYFNLFTPDIKHYLLTIVKKRLREQLDSETWIDCIQALIGIGFSEYDEKFFRESIALALNEIRLGQ